MDVKRYFRDHDDDSLIVRVWYDEKGNRRGQYWGFKTRRWNDADDLAWMVADDIYDNHPMSDVDVERLIGQELD